MKRYCIFGLLIFLGFYANAQFQISSEIRDRFEFRDGYKKLTTVDQLTSSSISQRTRLSFQYSTDNIKLVFSPQDVRIWGDEQLFSSTGVYGDDYSLSLFEGYAEFAISQKIWLSAGRQQLKYDNQRILAARNWNQNGIAYDAVVLKFQDKNWNAHIGSSWNSINQNNNLYPNDKLKTLNFLWINKKLNDKSNVSFVHIASGVTETDSTNVIFFKQTTGLFVDLTLNKIKFQGDGFYQYGQNNTGQNISAFLFDADVAFELGKFTPHLGIGYLSGDKNLSDNTDCLFDVLYGARHKYFGYIDYFSDFTKNTKQGGLVDYYCVLAFKFSKKNQLENTVHYFQLSQSNSATPLNKDLGFENDFILKYKFNEWGDLNCGYSFFVPTSNSLETIQNVSNPKFSQFVYIQLTISPIIFEKKSE
ncbi:MAG: alginate export family protein [Bacteroidales bacterium]|nr:alginate export family protein [Bacteroidales bacterium]